MVRIFHLHHFIAAQISRFVPFFRNKFPELFQDSNLFFQDSKIHIYPVSPKISMLILLTNCHTFHIFYLSSTHFQNFPGPVTFFQDFPVLENATTKFQDFPGYPGPVRTLKYDIINVGGLWTEILPKIEIKFS